MYIGSHTTIIIIIIFSSCCCTPTRHTTDQTSLRSRRTARAVGSTCTVLSAFALIFTHRAPTLGGGGGAARAVWSTCTVLSAFAVVFTHRAPHHVSFRIYRRTRTARHSVDHDSSFSLHTCNEYRFNHDSQRQHYHVT